MLFDNARGDDESMRLKIYKIIVLKEAFNQCSADADEYIVLGNFVKIRFAGFKLLSIKREATQSRLSRHHHLHLSTEASTE